MSTSAAATTEPDQCPCGLTFEALDRRNLLTPITALCTAIGADGNHCNRRWAEHPHEGASSNVATKRDILLIRNDLRLLKLKTEFRLPRSASETSTAVTPAEPDLRVEGHDAVNVGIVNSAISNSVEGALKDAEEYYTLLRDHINYYGGANYPIFIRNKEVVITHTPFKCDLQEVVFPYTASSVKNHWIVLCGFRCDCDAYFKWAFAENITAGREGEITRHTINFSEG